jgi:hypothetical protein
MSYFDAIETRSITLVDDAKNPVATTSVVKNNRGQMARVSTQFVGDYPAESETIAGEYAWKKGEILIQHQLHDGRGKCRLVTSGTVDMDGGLSWVIDSTTTAASGSAGQEESAPLVINVGEAKGLYLTLFTDGRVKFRSGAIEYETTVEKLTEQLARNE